MDGKLVVLTGASEGIGRAAARQFAARGAKVVAVARSEPRLASLASEASGRGSIVPRKADVTDLASMETLAGDVQREHGLPDVVVANAGLGADALFTETTDQLWREIFEINVFGVVRTLRPWLPAMIERGSGRLLMISSVVGKRGIPHYAAYAASKHALHGLAESLRPELWRTGVTVGLVCPSSTDSEFHSRKRRRGPAQRSVRVARHSAESVAKAIVEMAGSTRRERVLSVEGKLMSALNTVAPGLVDRILARLLAGRREGSEG